MIVMRFAAYILLFVFGNAFSSVLHFLLEDKYDVSPEHTFLFGTEYGSCIATILMTSAVLLAYFYLKEKYCVNLDSSPAKNKKTTSWFSVSSIDDEISLDNGILAISILSVVYHCVCVLYLYITFALNFVAFLKIAATLMTLLLLIAYLMIEKKHRDVRNFKLYYSTVAGIMLFCNGVSILAMYKYANPEIFMRIVEDCDTYEIVDDIGSEWKNNELKNIEELSHYLSAKLIMRMTSKDITYKLKDSRSIVVHFNLISLDDDVRKVRAEDRLNRRHYHGLARDRKNYKVGANSKTFTRKTSEDKIENTIDLLRRPIFGPDNQ
ncbi:hypothetical protein FACS189472_04260 [Alphaproteobacteria bacterium]|nr:hypothetical protein FACS189472_04260 [Alphaproteobacteria bacterium]